MSKHENQEITVQYKIVVTLAYILEVDGQVVEETEEQEYIQFLQGHGQIIPGLESQLYGMSKGESKQIIVSAEEGYGEIDVDAVGKVPRDEFPSEIPLEKGVELQMRDKEGDVFDALR
jgi:FKBP-type peptidyl-prolyl cis-trans isomerase SlyD